MKGKKDNFDTHVGACVARSLSLVHTDRQAASLAARRVAHGVVTSAGLAARAGRQAGGGDATDKREERVGASQRAPSGGQRGAQARDAANRAHAVRGGDAATTVSHVTDLLTRVFVTRLESDSSR